MVSGVCTGLLFVSLSLSFVDGMWLVAVLELCEVVALNIFWHVLKFHAAVVALLEVLIEVVVLAVLSIAHAKPFRGKVYP